MFWNDLQDIKRWMSRLDERLGRIDDNLCRLVTKDGRMDSIERSLESLEILIQTQHQEITESVEKCCDTELACETMDKFEDYMRNVDKINSLINEFKGCVSVARGALEERKAVSAQEAKTGVLADMTKEIHKSMLAFIEAGNKIKNEV